MPLKLNASLPTELQPKFNRSRGTSGLAAMRTAVALGLVATTATTGAFQVRAPPTPRRTALALRSTAPEVDPSTYGQSHQSHELNDAMVAQLRATAVGIDQAQQAQQAQQAHQAQQAYTPGALSQPQYDGEVARGDYGAIRRQNALVEPSLDALR